MWKKISFPAKTLKNDTRDPLSPGFSYYPNLVWADHLWSWWEKQTFQKFTVLMPLLTYWEHSCCLWLGQSKYFYSSVVLENDVYSSPGDGCQRRLNTVFLIVFFFFTVSHLCGFCSFFVSVGEMLTSLFLLLFFGCLRWFAATVKLLGYKQHPSGSPLHVRSRQFRAKVCLPNKPLHLLRSNTGPTIWSFLTVFFNHLSGSHRLSCSSCVWGFTVEFKTWVKRFGHVISSWFRPKCYLLAVTGVHLIKFVSF